MAVTQRWRVHGPGAGGETWVEVGVEHPRDPTNRDDIRHIIGVARMSCMFRGVHRVELWDRDTWRCVWEHTGAVSAREN